MPKDIAGMEVILEGNAFVEQTSVDELRHYAEDEGKTAEEIEAIFSGLEKTRNINVAINAVNKLVFRDGYDGLDIIESLIKHFKNSDANINAKLFAFEHLAEIDFRLVEGARPHIQLYGFFTKYLKFTKRQKK